MALPGGIDVHLEEKEREEFFLTFKFKGQVSKKLLKGGHLTAPLVFWPLSDRSKILIALYSYIYMRTGLRVWRTKLLCAASLYFYCFYGQYVEL